MTHWLAKGISSQHTTDTNDAMKVSGRQEADSRQIDELAGIHFGGLKCLKTWLFTIVCTTQGQKTETEVSVSVSSILGLALILDLPGQAADSGFRCRGTVAWCQT